MTRFQKNGYTDLIDQWKMETPCFPQVDEAPPLEQISERSSYSIGTIKMLSGHFNVLIYM